MINAFTMPEELGENSASATTYPKFITAEFRSFHSPHALYKLKPMINRADILFADAALRGASLRGLLILIRL